MSMTFSGIEPPSNPISGPAYVTLNAGQRKALIEIKTAFERGARHLLTGYAGSGKTTLMQAVVQSFMDRGLTVVVTAPTHKAVAVLARKMHQAGLEVQSCTVHSLLSLRPRVVEDRQVFERTSNAKPVLVDVVIIDEASMIPSDLMGHIRSSLKWQFVLFVGDPAQLPPVGEIESEAFGVVSRSHLDTIVRQAEGNPILEAALIIRESQSRKEVDWSWMDGSNANRQGLFKPGPALVKWMERAFLSDEFEADPDFARYLCWTNARVHFVNRMVRQWRYGKTDTPLMPGEPCMVRTPVFVHSFNEEYQREETEIVMQNCEEGIVQSIDAGTITHTFGANRERFTVSVPVWEVIVECDDARRVDCLLVKDDKAYKRAENELREWCRAGSDWRPFFRFKEDFVDLRPLYALTVHSSQGSTFKHAIVDIDDIAKREPQNLLEFQQLLYVAVTRPTDTIIIGGVE